MSFHKYFCGKLHAILVADGALDIRIETDISIAFFFKINVVEKYFLLGAGQLAVVGLFS